MRHPRRISENVLHGIVLTACVVVGFAFGLAQTGETHTLVLLLVVPATMAFVAGAVSYRHEWWALVPIAIAVPVVIPGIVTPDKDAPTVWLALAAAGVLFLCTAAAALGAGAAALVVRLTTSHRPT